jgi:hypothetical protein
MKNFRIIFKSAIAVFLLLFSSNLFASSITSVEITPVENEKVFVLRVNATGSGAIDIRIKDKEGRTLFSDQHESLSSFVKRINIDALENGNYTFEIEDEMTVNFHEMIVNDYGVAVSEKNSSKLFKPIIKWSNNERNLDVNWLLSKKDNVKVTISDESSNVVHISKMKNEFALARRFNLESLDSGNYYVTVKNKDRTYYKKIHIK